MASSVYINVLPPEIRNLNFVTTNESLKVFAVKCGVFILFYHALIYATSS